MLKRFTLALLVITLLVSAMTFSVNAAENALYVSPTGSDSATGTIDDPLATMEGARARVLQLKNEGTYINEVIFRGGDYRVTKTINFTAEDSGTTDSPIVYKAYEGETPKFKGSILLDPSKAYTLVDTRIHPEATGKVLVFDLTQFGLTKADICDTSEGKVNFEDRLTDYGEYNTLFIDDTELDISTWPNGQNYAQWDYVPEGVSEDEKGRVFHYTSQEPDRWKDAKNWWIGASPQYDFQYFTVSVKEIDTVNDTITVSENPANMSFIRDEESPKSQKWKAFNLLEEIDVPGEFSIDRANMKLYLYPPYDIKNSKLELSVFGKSETNTSTAMLSVTKAKNLVFEGLEFSQSRQNAVELYEINNVDFIDCTFTNIAGRAIINSNILSYWQVGGNVKTGFDPYHDETLTEAENHNMAWRLTPHETVMLRNDSSYNMDIRGCVFSSIGKGAMYIQGGNIDSLTKSGNIIEDNFITAVNKRYSYQSAIYLSGCGNTLRNNVITHSSQNGVMINGSLHTVEKNEIYDVMRDTGDFGAIYQGGSILYRGTEIKENYIHDILPANPLVVSGAAGIYQDEGQQGNYIHNNIIVNAVVGYNSNWAGCMEFKDNTIVNCNRPWAFYDHWIALTQPQYTYALDYGINRRRSSMGIEPLTLEEYINTIPVESMAKYRETFPKLFRWAEAEQPFNAKKQSVYTGNLIIGPKLLGKVGAQEEECATWSANVQVAATTEFVDARNHDYRLKSGLYLANKLPGLLNDTNFEMSSIGLVNNSVSFDKNTSPYRLLYPENGASVSKKGLMLMWQEAFGANEYLVEISTDADFTDIIFSEKARYNHIDASKAKIYSNGTYYWRVTAINTSKNQGTTWISDHATGSFKIK